MSNKTLCDTTVGVICLLAAFLWLSLCALPARCCFAQDAGADEDVIQMIAELVKDSDRDMRALGFQQIREEVPGEAATKKFAALLPDLPPDGQAGLLEALGDRQDPAALDAVLKSLESDQATVRAAAIVALGALGGEPHVPVLAEKAAAGSPPEQAAARQGLIRLRGDGVNAAIQAAMTGAQPGVRVVLLDVLAARNARQSLPVVFQNAEDPDPSVRLAALRALRSLAEEKDAAAVVALLKRSADQGERRAAGLALLTICSRGREACADAVIAGLTHADAASRIALLDALARAGGDKALEAVAGRLEDEDEAVRDEAARMLSHWPTSAAIPRLKQLAQSDNPRHQVLAVRGLVRLASQQGQQTEQPADLEILAEAMTLAKRPQEKRLVLGVLGGVPSSEALALVTPALDDPQVANEAGLAAVLIGEKMDQPDPAAIKAALEKVLKSAASEAVHQRAQELLEKKK